MATPAGFEPAFFGGNPKVLGQLDDGVIIKEVNYSISDVYNLLTINLLFYYFYTLCDFV